MQVVGATGLAPPSDPETINKIAAEPATATHRHKFEGMASSRPRRIRLATQRKCRADSSEALDRQCPEIPPQRHQGPLNRQRKSGSRNPATVIRRVARVHRPPREPDSSASPDRQRCHHGNHSVHFRLGDCCVSHADAGDARMSRPPGSRRGPTLRRDSCDSDFGASVGPADAPVASCVLALFAWIMFRPGGYATEQIAAIPQMSPRPRMKTRMQMSRPRD